VPTTDKVDDNSRVIIIGASAGGVGALLRLAPQLSGDLAAPVLVVLHIGSHRSHLPELLSAAGPNEALFARTGTVPRPGRIYVAPPDQHLLLESGVLRLSRGPKEHHARPAIDPTFRSAALDRGPRAVGVVLTGMLDDGSAGLQAIKACGGVAVVQDPGDAAQPSMPRSALAAGPVDHVAKLDAMGNLLNALAQPAEVVEPVSAPDWLRVEHALSLGKTTMQELATIGAPSAFTCPDCGGALFERHEGRPVRFICHTGHAFSLRSLAATQEQAADDALWSGLRALQEKEAILRRLAAERSSEAAAAAIALDEADKLAAFIDRMRTVVRAAPTSAAAEDVVQPPEEPSVETGQSA